MVLEMKPVVSTSFQSYQCNPSGFKSWPHVENNHEFVHENMKKPEYVDLMRRLGALGDGNQDLSGFFFPVSLCLFFEFVAYSGLNQLSL
jgi:hypothetical protein